MFRRKYKYDAKEITHNMMCTYEEGTGDCQVGCASSVPTRQFFPLCSVHNK